MADEKRSKAPLVLGLGALGVALVGAGIGAAFFLYRPMSKELAIQAARDRGVELDCDVVEPSLHRVELGGCRFTLIGVRGLNGTFRTASIELEGTRPKSIEAEQVNVRLEGSGADLTLDVGEWANSHPRAFRTPVTGKRIEVAWSATAGGKPWLEVDGGTLASVPDGAVFVADSAKVAGTHLGKVGSTWRAKGDRKTGSVALGFGKKELDRAPVTLDLDHGVTPPTGTVTLRPTSATDLALPLGVALPIDGVTISGQADLTFEGKRGTGPIRGKISIVAKGYVPPHPVELQGIVFGDKTTFATDLEIDAARETATLTSSKVKAGAFALTGGGKITRADEHSTIAMDLQGAIPCTEIARSAANARIGGILGGIVGGLARQSVQGSVGVTVKIRADTRRLEEAKLVRTVGVGCGIGPLRVPSPKGFELPPIPSGLPPVPKDLPAERSPDGR